MADAPGHTEELYRKQLVKVTTVFPKRMSFMTLYGVFLKDLLGKFLSSLNIRQDGASLGNWLHFTYEHYESRSPPLLGYWNAQHQMRGPSPWRRSDFTDALVLFLMLSQPSVIPSFVHLFILFCYIKQILVMHFSKIFWTKKGRNKQLFSLVFFSLWWLVPLTIQLLPLKPWKSYFLLLLLHFHSWFFLDSST